MLDWTIGRPTRAVGMLILSLGALGGCEDGAEVEEASTPLAAEPALAAKEQSAGRSDEFAWPADCQEKYKFVANDQGEPTRIPAQFEGYREFFFDLPWRGSEVHAVAIRPLIDNKRVVHHFVLYDDRSAHLAHWAPGGGATDVPSDVGIYLPRSGRFKLEAHYYNRARDAAAEADQSGFEICITRKLRPHSAGMFPFTAPALAPAGRRTTNTSTCTVSAASKVRVIASAPHMHKLGTHAKLELVRTDGTVEVLHDRPFAFDAQQDYPLDVFLSQGDRVRTTCVYDNPCPRDVALGPGSDDEMCFNFVTYYPRCALHCTSGDPLLDALTAAQEGECTGHAAAPHPHPASPAGSAKQ